MKKTILIIDDNADILNAVRLVLETSGYTVDVADGGEYIQTLLASKKKMPHLILLDVLLSGQDGRMLAKILKTHDKTKEIPIVMMSAHPNAEKSMTEFKIDDFLSKPFDIDRLLGVVRKHIA